MALPLEKLDRPFTYGDYLSWPQEERWELLEGIPVAMTSPGRRHQEILRSLSNQIYEAEKGGHLAGCKCFLSPLDVRLPAGDEASERITTVVQPDLFLVCDPSKLDERGVLGAPDLVVEILFPTTATNDLQVKKDLYEKHGVREYWIVQPGEKIAIVYFLEEGRYDRGSIYTEEDTVTLRILPDVQISFKEVFSV